MMINTILLGLINESSNKLSSICVGCFVFWDSSDSEDSVERALVSLLASNYSDLSVLRALQVALATTGVVMSAYSLISGVTLGDSDVPDLLPIIRIYLNTLFSLRSSHLVAFSCKAYLFVLLQFSHIESKRTVKWLRVSTIKTMSFGSDALLAAPAPI
jgi:hypothetical protein